jgi:hypothetical protein
VVAVAVVLTMFLVSRRNRISHHNVTRYPVPVSPRPVREPVE